MFGRKHLLVTFLLGMILVSGCVSQPGQQTVTTQEQEQPTGEVKEFTMSLFSFGVEPSSISVNAGDRVRLTIENKDSAHTFTIDELGVNEWLSAGETKTIEFVASKKGTFAFYCAVPGHRSAGMEGQIVIS